MHQSSSKKEIHKDKCLPQEKKVSSKQPNFIPQGTRKITNEAQS